MVEECCQKDCYPWVWSQPRTSIGAIVKASSGSNTLLVKVSFPYFLHLYLTIFHVQVYPFSKYDFHWITCLLNWYSECLYSWQGAVETLLEHRCVLWVPLFGDLSWRRRRRRLLEYVFRPMGLRPMWPMYGTYIATLLGLALMKWITFLKQRHVLCVPSPAWNTSPAQRTRVLLAHSASCSSLVIPSTSDDSNSCFAFNRQDERDGQEATKVSCEYVGLCFQ
jgi:hypothetical protein